jgi:cobalt-zinc-cadmium efflux system protein
MAETFDSSIHGDRMSASHSHGHEAGGSPLGLSLFLTLGFVVAEGLAGYFAGSLALLSDAGHNLADVLALGFSWYAIRLARRPPDARRTFGYHRAGILAALINAVSLVVLALIIFIEAVSRLRDPEPVSGGLMIVVALISVILNTVISLWLRREAKDDLNIRSAYLHMLGDAVSALGVVIAGIIIVITGWQAADPVVSFLIGALILWSSWEILVESVNVLLEGVPAGLDLAALEAAVREVPGVRGMHDLHVWTVSSGILACSCHILVDEQSVREGQQVLRGVADLLKERYRINHATIQIEVEGCSPDDPFCVLRRLEHGDHSHGSAG